MISDLRLGVLSEHPEYGHLSGHCFAGPRGSPQQDVGVRVVEDVEDLGLYWVEVREFVQGLQAGVVQGRLREGCQIQELCNKRVGIIEPIYHCCSE